MTSKDNLQWKHPDEVMKLHKLKLKKKALQERMNRSGSAAPSLDDSSQDSFPFIIGKRKNPFKSNLSVDKKVREDEVSKEDANTSLDTTLFQALNRNSCSIPTESFNSCTSFAGIFNRTNSSGSETVVDDTKRSKSIPIDWSLKTKIRFMSETPFPWNQNLKTSEEASGITGFVRCLDTGICSNRGSTSLDTSHNARFHQCCLIWQYPSLPWLNLFPRTRSSSTSSSPVNSFITSDTQAKDLFHNDWGKSFLSLFQLLRACQCPYFYLCANSFTCLFRASGICGHSDIHALLTPTTRGFRQLLKDEDVMFTMPLRSGSRRSTDSQDCSSVGFQSQAEIEEDVREELDDGWLESMGVSTDEIWRLNSKQAKLAHQREQKVDQTKESLIYVEGVEVQALFNFLINCKSVIALTGHLAGIPPTLLSPVAFHGATLKPLKVRQNKIVVGNTSYHSTEILGPILPHAIHNLSALLIKSMPKFSATFANLESTSAFSLTKTSDMEKSVTEQLNSPAKDKVPAAFGKVKLSDCGLQKEVLEKFCSAEDHCIQLFDTLKSNGDLTFTWS